MRFAHGRSLGTQITEFHRMLERRGNGGNDRDGIK